MQIGEQLSVKIEKIVYGGKGLARADGWTLFVPDVVPGETVRVEVVRLKRGYGEGVVRELIDASPHRRNPPCPLFGTCGGCDLQHMEDRLQLSVKVESFREVLARIAHLRDIPLAASLASPQPFGYRFRVQLKRKGKGLGFFRRGSHEVVPLSECPIAHPLVNRTIAAMSAVSLTERPELSTLREVRVQVSDDPEQVLIGLRLEAFDPRGTEGLYQELRGHVPLVGLLLRAGRKQHLLGDGTMRLPLGGESLRVSEETFFQSHWDLNRRMVDWALSSLDPGSDERILELYAGAGNITLPLARRSGRVVAIEGSRSAVRDLKYNLKEAALTNVRLMEGPVEWAIQRLQGRFDAVVMDPPRSGVPPMVLQRLPRSARRILYLSCHPATLARDLRILLDRGWRLSLLQPIDLFPQTAHLEVGAVIDREIESTS